MIEYGEGSWTIWTAAALAKSLPADRYVLVASNGKETTPPLHVSLEMLQGFVVMVAPTAIEIKSAPGENVHDLLQLQHLKNWRDLPEAPAHPEQIPS